ncbi:hypothetical protein VPHD520_0099 [Vibrio phage D520]
MHCETGKPMKETTTFTFTSWQTVNIKAWIKRYEELIAAESFKSDPPLEAALCYQIRVAKEELTTRLLKGTL